MKQENWIENTKEGSEIYDILYSNLPTIDAGGCVTEEQIWKCVNEVKNLAKPMLADSSLSVLLDYEIRSSWWASWIGWGWGQELSGKYFAWKTSRKYARYKQSKMWEQRIKNFS